MRDQTPKDIVFSSLLNWIREGRFMVPDFQRDFEWKARDIRDLTRSIFLEYYVGSLLLWKGKSENFVGLDCVGLHGQSSANAEHIVLDGQQRLTAIGYAFLAPDIKLPTRVNRALYYVRLDQFMAKRYDEAFDYYFVMPGGGSGIASAQKHFGTLENQYKHHWFPLSYAADLFALADWASGYSAYWKTRAENAESGEQRASAERAHQDATEFKDIAKGIISESKISYIELDRDLDVARVCDIFTQINSKGVRLDVFDLLNALLKPKGIRLRRDLWENAAPRLEFIDTSKLNVYILQVMSIQRQAYCSPQYLYYLVPGVARKIRKDDGKFEQDVLVATVDEFRAGWEAAVKALERSIETLRHPHEFGVSSPAYLPYYSILPVFAAALAEVDSQPPANQLAARSRFNLWYWASVFTNQYSASSETTAARDFQALRKWFADEQAEPASINEFRDLVPRLDLRGEAKKGFARYNAIFNLAVKAGARDFVKGGVPMPAELNDHHIVPKSWGKNLPAGSTSIDTILNRTPLTDHTNQHVIRDKLPNVYLAKLIDANGRKAVEEILASHFIDAATLDILLRDPFGPEDFEAFVVERQRVIIASIKDTILDRRADLPPDLRKLDGDVERIELALRALVAKTLDDDLAELPSHVREKIDPRIAQDLKRNPGLDADRYATLTGALEFADLTELLTIMTRKGETRFAGQFPTNELLTTRFGQLAGLRNGIRHSRTVTDVARKEGEAAILWFDAALKGAAA